MHSAGSFINSPALLTCHLDDEANGPLARRPQCVCHDTLPWLISFSLDIKRTITEHICESDHILNDC
jgi:hypothetical protein